MPTPVEILLDPISLGALAMYACLIAWEAIAPARPLPKIRGWIPRAAGVFAMYFFASTYLPLIWDGYLAQYRLIDLSYLGAVSGMLVGLVVYEVLLYAWHRMMHERKSLWRSFHQMHHSAERLDTFGAFYLSPLDTIGFTLIGSLSLALIVGLSPQAVTLWLFVTLFLAQLDVRASRMTYVDCGHGFAFVLRRNGGIEELLPRGLPLGVSADEIYQEGSCQLQPGDTFVLYSDGLVDAQPEGALDHAVIAASVQGVTGAGEMLERIKQLIPPDVPLPDDVTILVLRRDNTG